VTGTTGGRIRVEILAREDCPNRGMAVLVVERAVERSGVDAELRVVEVRSEAQAKRRRFLGSPSVLVDGVDVEPCTAERTDYSLAQRVYRCGYGIQGWPEEAWIRSALLMSAAQGEASSERSSATSP
jgi:hypothetical protein